MAWALWILQYLPFGIGVMLVAASLVVYVKRTDDIKGVLRFWEARIAFNRDEFILNRVGFALMLLGVVFRVIYHIFYL